MVDKEEYYIDLIKNSFSLAEVCRKANIGITGGNYTTLKNIINKYDLDVTHFKRVNSTKPKIKYELNEILKENFLYNSTRLKDRLFKEGYKDKKCENCGLTEWLGNEIPLDLHHINGNHTDNRIENLQILCGNCHKLTHNYGGKNIKTHVKKDKKCKTCSNILKTGQTTYCSNECRPRMNITHNDLIESLKNSNSFLECCSKLKISKRSGYELLDKFNLRNTYKTLLKKENKIGNRKVVRPSIEILLSEIKILGYRGTGRKYGVSDNAIRKWIKIK